MNRKEAIDKFGQDTIDRLLNRSIYLIDDPINTDVGKYQEIGTWIDTKDGPLWITYIVHYSDALRLKNKRIVKGHLDVGVILMNAEYTLNP